MPTNPRKQGSRGVMSADEAKKALQGEVVAVKTRWKADVKLTKAPADAPAYPLPLAVSRRIDRPDTAQAFDVDDMTVKLWVETLDATSSGGVRVEVVAGVPDALKVRMAAHVQERWNAELAARGAGKGWMLEKMLAWAEGAFGDLLLLDPAFVESYEGCDDEGRTIRRYAIVEPPPEPADVGDAEGDGEESSGSDGESESEEEEDIDDKVQKMKLTDEEDRALRIKLKAEAEAERTWREERRQEAEVGRPSAPPDRQQRRRVARAASHTQRHTRAEAHARRGTRAQRHTREEAHPRRGTRAKRHTRAEAHPRRGTRVKCC